ncbi:Uncharacterised protein [Ectopseudomonas oleovorans]|uniref:Uncharacterized protein n=1 Tax=Ectopseudomonas oleovorans TaxID=301 RepID=A0A379PHP6_ECTOL|nr:Uncharacterised protein [Pseudomonas oleovorans]
MLSWATPKTLPKPQLLPKLHQQPSPLLHLLRRKRPLLLHAWCRVLTVRPWPAPRKP